MVVLKDNKKEKLYNEILLARNQKFALVKDIRNDNGLHIFNLTDRMIHKNIDKKQVEKNVEARIRVIILINIRTHHLIS